ncbi:MAG TPA: hypothetical protein DDW81_01750 [Cryomorphaceae bacterium]|nr:hypothetical protein [Owenweeksia sp.]HBF18786.1 hypothetical protein [Cryomorphaceae bacterium]
MSDNLKYNQLQIPGAMLLPGFSIYLLELNIQGEKQYYVGMTGDPYYPSARAAFHRISGHLELLDRSTQNQLKKVLDKLELTDEDIADVNIIMHHFPIEGYQKWELTKSFKKEEMERVRNSAEYGAYKKRQRQIKALEDALIYGLKKSGQVHILNKTRGKKGNVQPEFEGLVASIGEVLKLDPGWIVNN